MQIQNVTFNCSLDDEMCITFQIEIKFFFRKLMQLVLKEFC